MSDKPIEVNFEDLDNKYYTLDEVSNILDLDQSKIIFYYEKLNDFLDISSIGVYQLFTTKDIENLKRIKHLDIDMNMSMGEIKKYLKTSQQEILVAKDSTSNQLDKNLVFNTFNSLIQTISEQNNKLQSIEQSQCELMNLVLDLKNLKKEISIDIIDSLNEKSQKNKDESFKAIEETKDLIINSIESNLTQINKQTKLLERQNKEYRDELEISKNKEIEELKRKLKEKEDEIKKREIELENEKNKSILSKLFKK